MYYIVPVALYGCETQSIMLKEEHKVRLSESRVLRGICRPKKEKVAGGWRRLH
jgi:hypothetical protein